MLLNKNIIIIVFFITSFLLISAITVYGYGNGANNGEYYWGYGDSIMRATNYDDLNGDYTDCFVTQMRETYDSGKTDDHNIDGGGEPSSWGLSNFASHYNSGNDYFIFMFGANDGNDGVSITETAQNMVEIYNRTLENGSIPILCIMAMCGDDHSQTYANTRERINATEDLCEEYSIPYVKMYDAIDADNWNGFPAPNTGSPNSWIDLGYYANEDNVHPNKTGHKEMASFLWYFIQGWDYNTTYHAGNDTLIVDADYNETIYINNTYYGWNTENLTITCLNNDTEMSYTLNIAPNGSQMIHFDITKDNSYSMTDDSTIPSNSGISFQSINELSNNSVTQDPGRLCNWTKIDGGTLYQLRISNSSTFDTTFFNETIDSENYTVKGDYVEYILPVNISWYGYHYYQVRAYT